MIPRYTRSEMGAVWSDETKYRCWLEVELAATEVLSEMGIVPEAAGRSFRQYATVNVSRIQEIEADVKHDVIAFTTSVAEIMASAGAGEHSRWLHYGLTSNDVVDTAQSLQIQRANAILLRGVKALMAVLRERAFEFQDTLQIGRTHGIHAEPITFGLKIALWFDEARRNLARLEGASAEMAVGKLSGAVGTFGHLSPEAEERICMKLGLAPAAICSQVISRDRHASYISTLALVAALCEKIALEVRHLQRTEVREAEESFGVKQKGSSAMPHKKNPVTSEQICGLARLVRSNAQAAFENIALWHERDISHSSVERVILPDSTILTDYLLEKTVNLVRDLVVFPERMRKNLESTKGLVFSGQLLLDLAEAGMLREDAYRLVQTKALKAWREDENFELEIRAEAKVLELLRPEQLDATFSPARQLQNLKIIFARVFQNQKSDA
ncbi:MAG: adenylosuccinate lyase [Bryobacterales bacterium]|nr:adenylosuccinate lyase [Bryobacterales bacterium]